MNTSVISRNQTHSLRYYRSLEETAFNRIPGMEELRSAASEEQFSLLQARYPDAAFALMTSGNLFCKDRELNEIHLKAYRAILDGENITNVRFRYDYDLEAYLERHLWDD